jgi:hypothetical protein
MKFVARKLSNKVDLKPYKYHVKKIVKLLQKEFRRFGLTVLEPENYALCDGKIIRELIDNHGTINGMCFSQQIIALTNILDCLLRSKKGDRWNIEATHIAVEAPTLSGKTGLQNLCAFLPVILHLLTGQASIIIRFLINDTSLEKQAEEEGKVFNGLYGHIRLKYKNETSTINEYCEMLKRNIKDIPPDFPAIGKFIRTSRSKESELEKLKEITHNKMRIIALCDESHYRANNDSVMSDMIPFFKESHKKWLDSNIIFIGLSATNYALMATFRKLRQLRTKKVKSLADTIRELGYPCLVMKPGENYTGIPWLGGEYLKDVIIPKVMSFSDIPAMSETDTQILSETRELLAESIDDKWINSFVKLVRYCLLFPNPADGRGMLVRVINDNNKTKEIIEKIKKKLTCVKFILHNQDKTHETIVGQVAKEIGTYTYYVVFVTGRGRLGSVPPTNCKYGIDFSRKSEPQPLLQGIFGRMTGYNKGVTWVILSEFSSGIINRYIECGNIVDEKNRPVSPYKRQVSISNCSKNYRATVAYPASLLNSKFRDELEKEIHSCAEIRTKIVDGKVKRKVIRVEEEGVISKKSYNKIKRLLENEHNCIICGYDSDDNGKHRIQVRMTNDDSADVVNTQDSLSKDRQFFVAVLHYDASLQCLRGRVENLCIIQNEDMR